MVVIFVKVIVSLRDDRCDFSPRGAKEPSYATGLTNLIFFGFTLFKMLRIK